jgi:hypothetical protein
MCNVKKCNKCGVEYPLSNKYFSKDSRTKSGYRGQCKVCVLSYNKTIVYNPIKTKESKSKHIESNKKMWAKYKNDNVQIIFKQKQEYYRNNKIKILKAIKNYQSKNKEKIIQYNRIQSSMRYNDKINYEFTNEIWGKCKSYFGYRCCYCGNESPLEREHFVAFSKKGKHEVNNILPSCKSCNSSKNNKDFFEWYPQQKCYSKKTEKKILEYLNYDTKTKIQQLSIC